MNRKIFLSMIILSVAVLPAIATAAVLINNPVTTNTNSSHEVPAYLAGAPGYSSARSLGYIGLTGGGSTSTGQTLYLNGTTGTGNITLVNVLEVVNNTSPSYTGQAYLYFNGTIPSGIQMYYSSSMMSYTGSKIIGGKVLAAGTPIHLTGSKLYLSIVMLGSITTGTGSLNLQIAYK